MLGPCEPLMARHILWKTQSLLNDSDISDELTRIHGVLEVAALFELLYSVHDLKQRGCSASSLANSSIARAFDDYDADTLLAQFRQLSITKLEWCE